MSNLTVIDPENRFSVRQTHTCSVIQQPPVPFTVSTLDNKISINLLVRYVQPFGAPIMVKSPNLVQMRLISYRSIMKLRAF